MNRGLLGIPDGGTQFYKTTLEPMQMLAQYRAGLPVVNHIFQPQQQFLPQGLDAFMAMQRPQIARAKPGQGMPGQSAPVGFMGGPGGDGSPGGVGTDGGADGSGGAGGGGK